MCLYDEARTYIDALRALWEEVRTELLVSSFGVVSFAALEERLDYMGWSVVTGVVGDNPLAFMHSCKRSGDRKLETKTPPSRSIISMIFSRGSEESMVTSEGAMFMTIRGRRTVMSNDRVGIGSA